MPRDPQPAPYPHVERRNASSLAAGLGDGGSAPDAADALAPLPSVERRRLPRAMFATYFDGRSAEARDVIVQVHGRNLVVVDRSGVTIDHQALALIRVQEALRHAPQRIDLANGATLVVDDKARLAAIMAESGIEPSFIERVQSSWFSVGCALVALLALLWCVYLWLLPWAASIAVRWLPDTIEERIAEDSWPVVDRSIFQPSRLDPAQQRRIRERFADIVGRQDDPPAYLLEFRDWSGGANAYAMPGGRIVVTDRMVAQAGEGDALMGVLAHELGHVVYRHTLRTLIQGAAVSGIVAMFAGDTAAVTTAIPGALLTLHYSRGFERDADDYAVQVLRDAERPVQPLASLLRSLPADAHRASTWQRFLSAHPVHDDRIERMLERERSPARRPAAP